MTYSAGAVERAMTIHQALLHALHGRQTWLQVAERISRYDGERPFGPWLFTVARNLALDHLRRRRP